MCNAVLPTYGMRYYIVWSQTYNLEFEVCARKTHSEMIPESIVPAHIEFCQGSSMNRTQMHSHSDPFQLEQFAYSLQSPVE